MEDGSEGYANVGQRDDLTWGMCSTESAGGCLRGQRAGGERWLVNDGGGGMGGIESQ